MVNGISTGTLGFGRIGPNRELKKVLEKHWKGDISLPTLLHQTRSLEESIWDIQRANSIDVISVGDFVLYDQVVTWIDYLGLVPARFGAIERGPARVFSMARGKDGYLALDMTKFFDTNYHYLVPELTPSITPDVDFTELFATVRRAIGKIGAGHVSAIVLGPVTLLHLAKTCCGVGMKDSAVVRKEQLEALLPCYQDLLRDLAAMGIAEIQIHEPALVLNDNAPLMAVFRVAYPAMFASLGTSGTRINMVSYFEEIGENYQWLCTMPQVHVISLDLMCEGNVNLIRKHGFPSDKILGAGVIDGRNVWLSEPQRIEDTFKSLADVKQVRVQPSCSLQFTPWDTSSEHTLARTHPHLIGVLAFSVQKLTELGTLAEVLSGNASALDHHRNAWKTFKDHEGNTHTDQSSAHEHTHVSKRLCSLSAVSFRRDLPYDDRQNLHAYGLPLLPTTTIGSFPQTPEVRRLRTQLKNGAVTQDVYNQEIDKHIAFAIGVQEGLGLDILVHGEPERTDMVEFFGAQLSGMAFTENGWVQSFGSRCVRPPIIFGDISRAGPMTVREYSVAQSLTSKPVKGMLTGPVTILNWSFPRLDVDRRTQALQLALAIRDEVKDLESAGCHIIQVDEPALRERMPLLSSKSAYYLEWAVDAFLLSTCGAHSSTQIHTHMCYCEFQDCMEAIDRMDTDVISIENARSDNSTLQAFAKLGYKKGLGPGIYDIHSPVVPTVAEISAKIRSFLVEFPAAQLIVNPDCGLKTRSWEQVIAGLKNMITATQVVRSEIEVRQGQQ